MTDNATTDDVQGSPGPELRVSSLSVIIPAYNEAATVDALLERVASVELPIHMEVIVVDDGSTDETAGIVGAWVRRLNREQGIEGKLIQKENGGKGSAVRVGITASTGDCVVIQDADLEYDPDDYRALLEPIVAGETDVVYGSRILGPGQRGGFWFYLGGRLVTAATNILYGAHLTDEPTCYKMFRGELLRSIPLTCTGFEFCPEVTAKVLKRRIRIEEVPIAYSPRSVSEGKKIRAMDGVKAILELLKWRFKS